VLNSTPHGRCIAEYSLYTVTVKPATTSRGAGTEPEQRLDTMVDLRRGLVLQELSEEPAGVREWTVESSDAYDLCSVPVQPGGEEEAFPGPGLRQGGSATFAVWVTAENCEEGPPSQRRSLEHA